MTIVKGIHKTKIRIRIVQMSFPTYLEKKFVEWQMGEGRRKSTADFAAYLGVSQSVISMWMNGSRIPNKQSVELLASIFGLEVYDALDLPRPDPDMHYLQKIWDTLSPSERTALREQAEKYTSKNETKRTHQKRRTRPS